MLGTSKTDLSPTTTTQDLLGGLGKTHLGLSVPMSILRVTLVCV